MFTVQTSCVFRVCKRTLGMLILCFENSSFGVIMSWSGRVGLGRKFGILGRIGSQKMDPWISLFYPTFRNIFCSFLYSFMEISLVPALCGYFIFTFIDDAACSFWYIAFIKNLILAEAAVEVLVHTISVASASLLGWTYVCHRPVISCMNCMLSTLTVMCQICQLVHRIWGRLSSHQLRRQCQPTALQVLSCFILRRRHTTVCHRII